MDAGLEFFGGGEESFPCLRKFKPLRAKTAAGVAAAVPMGPPALAALSDADLEPEMTGYGASDGPDRVRPGIEVLAGTGFEPLVGKRIGVITNHTGIDASGRPVENAAVRVEGNRITHVGTWSADVMWKAWTGNATKSASSSSATRSSASRVRPRSR